VDWTSVLLHGATFLPHGGRIARRVASGIQELCRWIGVGTAFRQMAYLGDRTGAFAILEEKRKLFPVTRKPNMRGSWLLLGLVVEGLVVLGEERQAIQLYPLTRELVDTGGWYFGRFPSSRGRSPDSLRQRRTSMKPPKNIFGSRCGKLNPFPICLNRRKSTAFMR